MGMIVRRGPKQYQARVRLKGHPSVCETFEDRASAEKWITDTEQALKDGSYAGRSLADKTTFGEVVDIFITDYATKLYKDPIPNLTKLGKFRRLYPELFLRPMSDIRGIDIRNFRQCREKEGMSASTIHNDMSLISKIFKVARSELGMESLVNPVAGLLRPTKTAGRERRPEGGELDKILSSVSPTVASVIRLCLYTAMRRGEATRILWEWVDLEGRFIELPDLSVKNGHGRVVPLPVSAVELLREVQPDESKRKGRVFNITPPAVSRSFRDARRRCGVENLRLHDLRHERVSQLAESGQFNMLEIAEISGHKTMQMLKRYSHPATEKLLKKIDIMEEKN